MNHLMKKGSWPAVLILLSIAQPAGAWGPEGHRVIGAIALDHVESRALAVLEEILGTDDRAEMVEWCNWPDEYRGTEEGNWSGPEHYINMVPGATEYERERDCPDGMCLTEVIGRYVGELGNPELGIEQRRRAFGRVCHFVGDMHQPLHAGFGHDRGGNEFAITYKGEPSDLHTLWDHLLIEKRTGSWFELYFLARYRPAEVTEKRWNVSDAIQWTNESHTIAAERAYPKDPEITAEFAGSTWSLILDRLSLGGARLGKALDSVLAEDKAGSAKCRR